LISEAVSSAGDVNGDGLDDLIIGAYHAEPNGKVKTGSSFVVFGTADTDVIEEYCNSHLTVTTYI
jgi:hypothetical protein